LTAEAHAIGGRPLTDFTYRYAPGLWVVTAYYNPAGYASRRRNYERFAQTLRQSGIPLLTVECAFGDQPFDLPESMEVVQVRGQTALWQKERLLNLAISWLPKSCRYVAWLDADVLFTNLDWAREAAALLESVPVVQLFETCLRLPQHYAKSMDGGDVCTSFASIVRRDPTVLRTGRFEDHGHTGYGWAARRELLDKHGLYELAIAGSGDHFMAHAIMGDFHSGQLTAPCVERQMLREPALVEHFHAWAKAFHRDVDGRLSLVSGQVLHLWHGELQNRRYFLRNVELAEQGFNPYQDIIAVPGKPLELRDRPALAEWFQNYFRSRREDGALATG
jgi:hypothetical protein